MSSNSKRKIAYYTVGCRANQYQTSQLIAQLTTNNLQLTTFSDKADVYVINTCTVTSDADRRSRQMIRTALRRNPKAEIIVTGCYARLCPNELAELSPRIKPIPSPSLEPSTQNPEPKIRENLMIEDGCNNFCAYCIVPYARGPVKSRPQEQVINEAKVLLDAGAREIVLTGINLGAYQHDLGSLVPRLTSLKKLIRLRLSSIEPMYLTEKLIKTVAREPKACHYFHVPLQTGDNGLLRRMKRRYTAEEYLLLIGLIRRLVPDCGISTDVIAGLPGETETAFRNTFKIIKEAGLSRLHVFPYSKRPGTPAAAMKGQVDPKTIKARKNELLALDRQLRQKFASKFLGQELAILVEQKNVGLTDNFIKVRYKGKSSDIGQLIRVKVNQAEAGECVGMRVDSR
ncbi:MAG: MiaB/RimO family radical SAM methylthiotransferase [Candidatus Saganbacteria bacterium]|nr:MiaB/RimO family radical SAM methylthiotransferase [Candidatus Saganbacteria bacterium]